MDHAIIVHRHCRSYVPHQSRWQVRTPELLLLQRTVAGLWISCCFVLFSPAPCSQSLTRVCCSLLRSGFGCAVPMQLRKGHADDAVAQRTPGTAALTSYFRCCHLNMVWPPYAVLSHRSQCASVLSRANSPVTHAIDKRLSRRTPRAEEAAFLCAQRTCTFSRYL